MERRIEASAAPTARSAAAPVAFGAIVLIVVVGSVLAVLGWPYLAPVDAVAVPLLPIAAIVYAALGALIVRRARNPFGWVLVLVGALIALMFATSSYAILGLRGTRSLPGAEIVGLVSGVLFVPVLTSIGFLLLLFPTGTIPSPRWRRVVVVGLVAGGIMSLAFLLTPALVELPGPGGISVVYPNPLGVPELQDVAIGTLSWLGVVSGVLIVAGAAALVVRYRQGDEELRQQIKWVELAAGAFVVAQVAITIAIATFPNDSWVVAVVGFVSAGTALVVLPVAITVAIFKYGLFEIDLIINRAVVYGLLAAAVTVVYVAIVVGIGALLGTHGGPILTIAAAVAIALLFQPLRQRAERVANRVVYGERASPYEVLSEFADSMANTLPLEEQLDRMVALLASGTGATRAEVWIRVGPELRATAVWPGDAPPPPPVAGDDPDAFDGATAVFPVRQDDERLGVIAVHKPPNEPLAPTEAALAEHVASQAGLVVRNVRLTAELRRTIEDLRASRRRLIDAQDRERRKIERNLHDGAQQQLVALGVQLGLLERLARAAPQAERVSEAIPRLQEMLGGALEDLRDLARGIYPPLLADRGLAVALDAQARKAAVPTTVDADGLGRYDRQVEAAVYFCTLEALQNVAKYADATAATVHLRADDGWLTFHVRDDGSGFEPDHASGSGLQGMADRLDAIGGSLEIDSAPGAGTRVGGRIPAVPLGDQE